MTRVSMAGRWHVSSAKFTLWYWWVSALPFREFLRNRPGTIPKEVHTGPAFGGSQSGPWAAKVYQRDQQQRGTDLIRCRARERSIAGRPGAAITGGLS